MADDSGTIVASGGSLNIPSGSGSERLRRVTVHQQNNGWANNVISGTAGHLYTILSITYTDQQGANGNIAIRVNNGTHDVYLLHSQSVNSLDTFVWNDKFVLEEDDDLDLYNSVTNGHWYITYIDQDWS